MFTFLVSILIYLSEIGISDDGDLLLLMFDTNVIDLSDFFVCLFFIRKNTK